MKWMKITYRWCYRAFWYSIVASILIIAVGMSIIRLYLPDVKEHREEIEKFASTILEHDVLIESMQAKLDGFTPHILFNDVYLLDESGTETLVHFEKAHLTIDLLRSLYNFKIVPESFTIIGVRLGIKRNKQGNFTIEGLDVDKLGNQFSTSPDGGDDSLARWFFERSRLAIRNSTVVWNDGQNKKRIQFDNVNFKLLNDGDKHQLSGRVSLPPELGKNMEVAFDFSGNILNPSEWSGEFYTKADGLNLVNWGVKPSFKYASLEQGSLDLKLWGDWEKGNIKSITADVKTDSVTLSLGKKRQSFQVKLMRGLVNWQGMDSGWKLKVNNFEYMANEEIWPASTIMVNYDKKNDAISAYASYLKIEDIEQVLVNGRLLEESFGKTLVGLNPKGILTETYADYSFNKNLNKYYFSTYFNSISLHEWDGIPGMENFSGNITLNESVGTLTLDSNNTNVELSSLFRKPIDSQYLKGEINWYKDNQAWHVRADDIDLGSEDITTDFGFYAMLPEKNGSPYIDLQVSYTNGDALKTRNYLPVGIMNDNLVNWLDGAFLSGKVTQGGVVLNGRLANFPFKDKSGTLLADFNAKDVELHYQKGWPNLQVNDADFEVSGLGITVHSDNARLYDSTLHDITVSVKEFELPVLRANGKFNGKTTDLARFLVNSPITPEAEEIVNQSKISGASTAIGSFQLPLSDAARSRFGLYYKGSVLVKDNSIDLWDGKLVAETISARIKFSPKGIFSDELKFKIYGGAAKGKLFTQVKKKRQHIKLTMQGEMDTGSIKDHIDYPMYSKISGRSNWQGVLNFGTKKQPGYFQLVSQLKGVRSDLPKPLHKNANSSALFELNVKFPEQGKLPITLKYDRRISTELLVDLEHWDKQPLERGELVFSDTSHENHVFALAELPATPGLEIKGQLSEFNIDDWYELINQNSSAKGGWMSDLNTPVNINLDYLNVMTNQSEEVEKEQTAAKDPRNFGLVNVNIKTFKFNERNFGHVRFNMERHLDGLRFNDFFIDAGYMKVEGEGSWLVHNGRQQTNMVVILSSGNLGAMLSQLGFSATIKHGKTKSVIQAHWFDAPHRFSIEKLNGNIGIVVDDGIIRDLKPGAGRLLGLFSVAELPRRLLLDFGELHNGLSFQQIVGQIEIRDGDAFADSLTIISPIALITIEGRTGLAKRDFNQHISVIPSVSGAIPAISWIAWGGQIGVLVFILEKIIGDKMNSSIADEYTITGTWENPIIKKLATNEFEENERSDGDDDEEVD